MCKKAVTRSKGGIIDTAIVNIFVLKSFQKNQPVSQPQGQPSSFNRDEHFSSSTTQPVQSPAGSVPESPRPSVDQEWHVRFVIPELTAFSTQVVTAINTGVVTGSARCEIVQILRTYVLTHTCNPKSEHYNTVCRKLIDKYPKLQDTEGDSRYVSEINLMFK